MIKIDSVEFEKKCLAFLQRPLNTMARFRSGKIVRFIRSGKSELTKERYRKERREKNTPNKTVAIWLLATKNSRIRILTTQSFVLGKYNSH